MIRPAVRAAILAAACLLASAARVPAESIGMEIEASPIDNFRIGFDQSRFGTLEFVGGLELSGSSPHFGALSSFRFLSAGGDFMGVADTGFWFFGTVERDEELRPRRISGFRMEEMVGADGRATREKWRTDAEGLAVKGAIATVGFEREHRVTEFSIAPRAMGTALRERDFLVPRNELRNNRGFETVAHAPAEGPLAGAMVVISEKSLDRDGNIFGAVLDGPRKGVFTVRRIGDFDITDGAFLPGGDLLILERRYTMATGVGMRLRRIAEGTIGAGKLADGPILLEADMGYQIDNMECLDVWRRTDGALVVSVMSDDNHSLLQRTLYLEFRLRD